MADNVINKIFDEGSELLKKLQDKIDTKNLSSSIKEALITERDAVQSILNDTFVKSGIINQSQIDNSKAVFNNAKKKLLEAQAKESMNRIVFWGGILAVSVFGYIIFVKYKNK